MGELDVDAVNQAASALMKQGIALMDDPRPQAPWEALECFDRALNMRLEFPEDVPPVVRFGLAASWMNRAEALMKIGDRVRVADAVRSFDEAIAIASRLPLDTDPRFVRRLAIAHQNRGLAQLASQPPLVDDAIASFAQAARVLDDAPIAAALEDRTRLLATILVNRARACAQLGGPEAGALARTAADRALDLVANCEQDDAELADIGLTARHVWCQTLAPALDEAGQAGPPFPARGLAIPDDVHAATDLADAGLTLIAVWEAKGVTRFRPMALDFLRFGRVVYARYQPQFVDEFVREHHALAQALGKRDDEGQQT